MPLSKLNSEQYAAATALSGHNLIIASAGTGKTSTIVGRIAHLLNEGVKPNEILLLTFTNKAAAQMVERLEVFFPKQITQEIDAGTFHAVSYRWLKKEDHKIILKQPSELKTLFRSIYEKRRFDHIDATSNAYEANYLYDYYSFFQNTTLKCSFGNWMANKHEEHTPFCDIYEDICNEFEELKKEYGFVNFNDLLLIMRDKVSNIKIPYREILIDEYQDTNKLQGSLIDSMNPPSLFCVGDYDQSIYAFNGADINIIASFSKIFPNAKVFNLSKNYRSTTSILDLANKVITYNERLYTKKLQVTRTNISIPPKLLIYEDLFDQYKAISKRIYESTTKREEIAVIFRNNASADGIEASLRELGVACCRRGGKSFFDAKEIKVILDIYIMIINRSDIMAFIHLFENAKGVGSAIAREMYEALKRLGDGDILKGLYSPDSEIKNLFSKSKNSYQLGLFDDILEPASISRFKSHNFDDKFLQNPILKYPRLSNECALFLYQFYKLMKDLKKINKPILMIRKIIDSKLYNMIINELCIKRSTQKDGSINENQKIDSLKRIKNKIALLHELSRPYNEHERFINAMVLGSQDLTRGEGVNLLSVHASKGLEYKEVYIIDLMDGRFPNRKLIIKGGSIEEERRLFYVAVTRAKDILFLSFAKFDKIKNIKFTSSQFLYEAQLIPKDKDYEKLLKGK